MKTDKSDVNQNIISNDPIGTRGACCANNANLNTIPGT